MKQFAPLKPTKFFKGQRISRPLDHDTFLKLKENRLSAIATFNNDNIIDKYGTFLQSQEWDYFCTFTTKTSLTLQASRRMMETLALQIGCGGNYNFENKEIPGKQFQESHEIPSTGTSMLFWAAEPFKTKVSYHMHALIKCGFTRNQIIKHWESKYGWSSIRYFDSKRPGAHYCAKYMTKTLSDYDLHT